MAVFIILNVELFRELGATFSLQEFTKISQLINLGGTFSARFDDIITTLYALIAALLFVIPVGWVYTITKHEEGYDQSLVQTIIVLALLIAGVMMVIQNDIARAFGLVGAVGAVRYRNTLKDPKDAVYIFLAIGIGMGCGFRLFHIAAWFSLFMNVVLLLLWKFRVGNIAADEARQGLRSSEREEEQTSLPEGEEKKEKKKPNATITVHAQRAVEAQQLVDRLLETNARLWHLTSISANSDGSAALEYAVRLNKELAPSVFIEDLRRKGNSLVTEVEYRSLKESKKEKKGKNGKKKKEE
jgi:hypothetical protein